MELNLRIKPRKRIVREKPEPPAIRSDKDPGYIGSTLANWAQRQSIRLDHIPPGKPQQNAYIERYNRTVRYDWQPLPARVDWQGTGLCKRLDVDLQSRTPQHGARRHVPETEVGSFNPLYF